MHGHWLNFSSTQSVTLQIALHCSFPSLFRASLTSISCGVQSRICLAVLLVRVSKFHLDNCDDFQTGLRLVKARRTLAMLLVISAAAPPSVDNMLSKKLKRFSSSITVFPFLKTNTKVEKKLPQYCELLSL